ncbi:efflux transporter outer membrane subunit [Candidatus Protochlamydia phocaeensis]|uniref:efflux transporter outer membrane subunit n=1 Tax=Candidatus Protochlamydia phocaeensis TaxID=1414722 RepID=UPI0009AC4C19|nr:efflux transporter outer membrane subunit [Candidatus Protochlamydia phocaeensis]
MRKSICLLSLFLSLTACFRPTYDPPCISVPQSWRLNTDEGSTLCNMRWWEQFNDPILNQYIIVALQGNQNLQVAIARVREYYARLGIADSFLLPTINGNASFTRSKISLASANLFPGTTAANGAAAPALPTGFKRIFNDYQLFLSLNWELDFWGRLQSLSAASYAELLAQVEARRAVVMMVTTAVANAYITLRQLDAQLAVSQKTLESRLESLKLAQYRFEMGETSEIEVKQAEAEVEIAAIRVIEFQRDIPQQENLLSILLGENPHYIERGSSLDALQYPPTIPAGLPSDLLTRRPDIIQAEDNLIAANARVFAAEALYFPQINLTGTYGSESEKLHRLLTSPAEMWQYGLNLIEPLFDAGRTYFQVEEAEAVRAEALFNYRQVVLTAFREVNDALIAYRKDRELVHEHQRQVKVLADYLHLAQLRYAEGEVDYLNVLDAERSLFDAQLQLVQAQADSFIAIVQLYNALGGGWVTDADNIALAGGQCELIEMLDLPNKCEQEGE